MKCIHCSGRMKKSVAPFHIDRKGYHLSLDAVPAWVCTQCGEPLFEEREARTNSAPLEPGLARKDSLSPNAASSSRETPQAAEDSRGLFAG